MSETLEKKANLSSPQQTLILYNDISLNQLTQLTSHLFVTVLSPIKGDKIADANGSTFNPGLCPDTKSLPPSESMVALDKNLYNGN